MSTTDTTRPQFADTLESLIDRIGELEAKLEQKDDRIEQLEQDRNRLEERMVTLENRVGDLDDESTCREKVAEAALNKASTNKDCITELQSRELENVNGGFVPSDTLRDLTPRHPVFSAGRR